MSGSSFPPHLLKSLLQEHCQKTQSRLPRYVVTKCSHDSIPAYWASVSVLEKEYESCGFFRNKKLAEQDAAKKALIHLGILQVSPEEQSLESDKKSDTQIEKEVLKTEMMVEQASATPSTSYETSSCNVLSPTSFVSHKNSLQEKAQRFGFALPGYKTLLTSEGYQSTVTFNGQSYSTQGNFKNKKQAEQHAAFVALDKLAAIQDKGPNKQPCHSSPTVIGVLPAYASSPMAGVSPSNPPITSLASTSPNVTLTPLATPVKAKVEVSYKNILQEHLQQRGMKSPAYRTIQSGFRGFQSAVQFSGKTISNPQHYSTKKLSEQSAARAALISLGFHNPEQLAATAKERKRKSKQLRGEQAQHRGDCAAYVWEKRARKRTRQDDDEGIPNKRLKINSPSGEMAPYYLQAFSADETWKEEKNIAVLASYYLQSFSVGEIWKEKKNVVVVGDSEISFILYCTRVTDTCKLLNTRRMEEMNLEPGCRIIGLDAQFVEYQGKVVLQAERCADIETPSSTYPVLTSCGVVIVHVDPHNRAQVLLKRYLVSQAFVNIATTLVMYLRRASAGLPINLDIEELTEHIRDWMSQEVKQVAAMTVPALRQALAQVRKFNEKWCSILQPPLPLDLQQLQAQAKDELARRTACDVRASEDDYHPWSLPKGNFKHRVITTGLHIETPSECAARELREETGIMMDPSEVNNMTFIDLPQNYNLNPHKGDVSRYFLYIYNPINEVLITSWYDSGLSRRSQDESFNVSTSSCPDNTIDNSGVSEEGNLSRESSDNAVNQVMVGEGNLSRESADNAVNQVMVGEGNLSRESADNAVNQVMVGEGCGAVGKGDDTKSRNTATLVEASPTESVMDSSATTTAITTTLSPLNTPPQLVTTTTITTTLSPLNTHLQVTTTTQSSFDGIDSTSATTKSSPPSIHNIRKQTTQDVNILSKFNSKRASKESGLLSLQEAGSSVEFNRFGDHKQGTKRKRSASTDDVEEANEERETSRAMETSTPVMTPTRDLPPGCYVSSPQYQSPAETPTCDRDVLSPQYQSPAETPTRDRDVLSPQYQSPAETPTRDRDVLSPQYQSPAETPTRDRDVLSPQYQSPAETPTRDRDVWSSQYQSPAVRGGLHEECAWFTIEEARRKSPAFQQIYQTKQFEELLLSVKKA